MKFSVFQHAYNDLRRLGSNWSPHGQRRVNDDQCFDILQEFMNNKKIGSTIRFN